MVEVKEGCRYIRRDGVITGPIKQVNQGKNIDFIFADSLRHNTYTKDGKYLLKEEHPNDLMEQYNEVEGRKEVSP